MTTSTIPQAGDPIDVDQVAVDDEVRFTTGGQPRTGIVTELTKTSVHLRITSGTVERGHNRSARILRRAWASRNVTLVRKGS
ncbi:hypothetical protein [Nonomuraea sp. NPDC003214]